jgi:hypothetical protein
MAIYREVYDFAAKAGALEGYVYQKEKIDVNYLHGGLTIWWFNIIVFLPKLRRISKACVMVPLVALSNPFFPIWVFRNG